MKANTGQMLLQARVGWCWHLHSLTTSAAPPCILPANTMGSADGGVHADNNWQVSLLIIRTCVHRQQCGIHLKYLLRSYLNDTIVAYVRDEQAC